ncbi:hypothetical protein [Pseudonocardia sp.]|uniref:hypothetical protein n=1 Tax=Pseudonocardia sp. TaxID=60912 RepID=UPI0039C9F1FD
MTQTIPGSSAARSDTAETRATQELISGGHLVAKALKADGVDTIFTFRGSHIIDIYDGCVDQRIAPALRRARESGLPSLINVWADPDVYAPRTMNPDDVQVTAFSAVGRAEI